MKDLINYREEQFSGSDGLRPNGPESLVFLLFIYKREKPH